MNKKIFFFFTLFVLLFTFCGAQVSVIKVTGYDEYTKEEDFNNTYDIRVFSAGMRTGKCQAVRIHKNWFFTAAHCVVPYCRTTCAKADKECEVKLKNCEIRVILNKNSSYEIYSTVTSGPKNQKVFFDASFDTQTPLDLKSTDIALFKYSPSKQKITVVNTKEMTAYPVNVFLSRVKGAKAFLDTANKRDFSAKYLPIISFDGKNNYKLNRVLSIISIEGSKKEVKISGDFENDSDGDKTPVYFLKDQQMLLAKNFGTKQGISGSGVMTNTGELVGISSFNADFTYKKNDKASKMEYSGFAPFSVKSLKLLSANMGNDYYDLEILDASDGYATAIPYSKLPEDIRAYLNYSKK
ncbi:hypothetical protein Emin_0149 [Elusimicrobium minutum Pei191]|uniref:Uncharacterized protein n=1 Tax=Elusimicrobium minutum (strain Pei191) TaxID=445932 RepID=B2KBM7_ELUMP|nr:trypsin-like serine protease [Elusimicrobium minutum]ACC97714.1 hypothetical protein Emin_0149 [Elusimicrobium minutum Pei191]